MAHRAGRVGQVDSPAAVTGIRNWTLDYTVDTVDTTDFADAGTATYTPTISRWSGTFAGLKDGVPQTLGTSSTAITIKLYETQEASEFWTGSCFITGVSSSVAFDGAVEYSYTFQGTGALTVAAA
jgi:hypothetical protein